MQFISPLPDVCNDFAMGKSRESSFQSLMEQNRKSPALGVAHFANAKNCPAASVTCNSCGKKGHIAKVCKSMSKEVHELEIPELSICYMSV